jgi:hypothetical protein
VSKWNTAPFPENWSWPDVSNLDDTSMPGVSPPPKLFAETAMWSSAKSDTEAAPLPRN